MAKILVEIVGDAKKFKSELGTAGREAESFGKKISGGTHSAVKGLGIAAGVAAAGGIALLGKGLVDGVKTAIEHQKSLAQTNAVIKSTGGAANVTSGHILELTNHIEKMSGMDDLAVEKGANMLLTFKNIKNGVGAANQIFDKSVNILADMTTAMGTDPQKAAIQLGKALNDPIKGISALARVGVTFDAQQKKLIKTYVAHGEAAKAQKVILKELQSEFGGSAKAAGGTMAGQVNILKAHLEDLEQEIGEKVIPILTRLVAWAIANWPVFEANARAALKVVGDIWNSELQPALSGLIGIVKDIMGLSDGWKTVILAVGGAIAGIVIAIEAYTIATEAAAIAQAALNLAMSANPIGLVVIAVAALVGALVILYTRSETTRDIVNSAFAAIKRVGSEVINFFTNSALPAFTEAWGVARTVIEVATAGIVSYITGIKDTIAGVFNLVGDLIHGRWSNLWGDAKQIVKGLAEVINGEMMGIPGLILGHLGDIKNGAMKIGSGIVDGIGAGLASLGEMLARLIKAPINEIIDGWNAISFSIPKFDTHIPGVGSVGGGSVSTPNIARLASGGVVTRPTIALIGEAGPEEVRPLGSGGGNGGDVYVTVNGWVGNDQDIAERVRNELIRMGRNTTRGALGGFG